ncbi:MAG: hypothetical protein ACRDYC_01735 [Acidimicrobiales bacterium]
MLGVLVLTIAPVAAVFVAVTPGTAAAQGCAGSTFTLDPPSGAHVDGTACVSELWNNLTVTVTLTSPAPDTVFVCLADTPVSFTRPAACGVNLGSQFEAEAVPQGGVTGNGGPVTITESIVSQPTTNTEAVTSGDYLYLSVYCSGSGCPNGDPSAVGGGFLVNPPTPAPPGRSLAGLILLVGFLGVGFAVLKARGVKLIPEPVRQTSSVPPPRR